MERHEVGYEVVERAWWQDHGYLCGRPLGAGLYICLAEMIYTYRVMVCDEGSVYNFYCYSKKDLGLAIECWANWNGKGDNPVAGFTRDSRDH